MTVFFTLITNVQQYFSIVAIKFSTSQLRNYQNRLFISLNSQSCFLTHNFHRSSAAPVHWDTLFCIRLLSE